MDYRYAREARARRRVLLGVESLEQRDCPAAPTINLSTQQLSDGRVRVSGGVQDEHPSFIAVQLGGVVSATTTTLAGGMFFWEGNASAPGTITANCTDDEGLAAAQATSTLTNSAPTITLNVTYVSGKQVVLAGVVTDETRSGRTVTLAGVVNATVVTNGDGTFTWTGTASALGTVTATTTDFWGIASNTAQVALVSAAPVISNFDASECPGPSRTWEFSGQVTDESLRGLTVRFGGLPSLEGKTATVQSNGWFYLYLQLEEDEEGTAWCQTTDWWGQDSSQAQDIVRQSP